MINRAALSIPCVLLIGTLITVLSASPQARDHLTPTEIDLVKEAQTLDKRTEVFLKAIDRRLMVINGTALPNTKQSKKEAEIWGDVPTGSRAELVGDIARILDEAITNIDDVSSRDEKNPLIAKALRRLAQGVNSIMSQLSPLREKVSSEAEVASFELLNEDAKSILEAVNKLPPEVEKKGKSKNDRDKH